jgi:hypothetical protein
MTDDNDVLRRKGKIMATTAEIDWPKELERLAKEAAQEALMAADEKFAEYAAEHERQTAGYSFDCKRFGDFLTVFVERIANEPSWSGGGAERKYSTAVLYFRYPTLARWGV